MGFRASAVRPDRSRDLRLCGLRECRGGRFRRRDSGRFAGGHELDLLAHHRSRLGRGGADGNRGCRWQHRWQADPASVRGSCEQRRARHGGGEGLAVRQGGRCHRRRCRIASRAGRAGSQPQQGCGDLLQRGDDDRDHRQEMRPDRHPLDVRRPCVQYGDRSRTDTRGTPPLVLPHRQQCLRPQRRSVTGRNRAHERWRGDRDHPSSDRQ